MADKTQLIQLRKMTGCGMGDCREALEAANGNIDEAVVLLRKKGLKTAEKRADRAAAEGIVVSYIHSNKKVGVLLELNCETDFVARNEDFYTLANDIAMHIAAAAPAYLRPEDVPEDVLENEKAIAQGELVAEGKAENMLEKIFEGKLKKFYAEHCLLRQEYMKDESKTVE